MTLNIENRYISKEEKARHADIIIEKLLKLTSLDFNIIRGNHSMVGTEEPIIYEFSNLILNKGVKNVAEFGCGMSTLWFTYLSKLNPSVNFIAFEHEEKWKNECIRLIKEKININQLSREAISIDDVNIRLTNDEHVERLEFPFKKVDLIFVDGLDRLGTLAHNADILDYNTIIIADDVDIGNLNSDHTTIEGHDSWVLAFAKKFGYEYIYYFWSRDRSVGIMENKHLFNTEEQLCWTITNSDKVVPKIEKVATGDINDTKLDKK